MFVTCRRQTVNVPTLTAAAFGEDTACWPLPAAATAQDRWLRAVAAGAQGYYGSAYTELAELRRSAAGPLASLGCSTQGSLLRQLGWHRLARGTTRTGGGIRWTVGLRPGRYVLRAVYRGRWDLRGAIRLKPVRVP